MSVIYIIEAWADMPFGEFQGLRGAYLNELDADREVERLVDTKQWETYNVVKLPVCNQ